MKNQKDLNTVKVKSINNKKIPMLFDDKLYGCKIQINIIKYIKHIVVTGSDYKFSWSKTPDPTYLTANKNKYMAQAKKVTNQFMKEEK